MTAARRVAVWPALAIALCGAAALGAEDRGEASVQVGRIEKLLEEWNLEAARAEVEALARVMPADAEPLKYYQGRVAF